jgi:hypothetical protein
MASEEMIKRALDRFTRPIVSDAKALRVPAKRKVDRVRRIIKSENVVALGIGEKISKRKPTGTLALIFYVAKKVPLKKLAPEMVVPPSVAATPAGEPSVPTDVVVLGKMRPEIRATWNPVQPGFSIGHVDTSAGTIGAVVNKGKQLHLLSNSHVLALSGTAKKGDSIIYPGDLDGGAVPDDVVATLSGFKEFELGTDFVNRVDCAIALPKPERLKDLLAEIKGVGLPKGTIKAKRGMKVIKVGRTTGKTKGEIRDVNFRFVLTYDEVGEVGFIDQVLCTRYTKPGDSGALVLDTKTGKAVGLHFAGASGGSVFCPIDEVLKALGVKLVTKPLASNKTKSGKKRTMKAKSKKR